MDARFYNPVTFAAFLLGFRPDPVQSRILLSTALRGVLNCTRQWGKSSIMAVKALWEAMTVHGTTVLVLCPTFKQAGEFFQKVRSFCWKLGIDPVTDGHNRFSVQLPNRSRVIGVSGLGHLRSYGGVSLLLVDEAAEVDETAYYTSRAFVATVGEFGGKIWLMSTPQAATTSSTAPGRTSRATGNASQSRQPNAPASRATSSPRNAQRSANACLPRNICASSSIHPTASSTSKMSDGRLVPTSPC